MENLYNTGLTDQKTILYKYWKNITCIYTELSLYKKNTWNNWKRIYWELILVKHYLYLYRTLNCTKLLLGIIEREFMENLYNTGLTDQKTILYKYWKNILWSFFYTAMLRGMSSFVFFYTIHQIYIIYNKNVEINLRQNVKNCPCFL